MRRVLRAKGVWPQASLEGLSSISTTSAASMAASRAQRAHGDADVRAGEHRRVVDAVADERERAAPDSSSSSRRCSTLSRGQQSGVALVYARSPVRRLRAAFSLSPVSITVFRDAKRAQRGDGGGRVGLQLVADDDMARDTPSARQMDHRAAQMAVRANRRRPCPSARRCRRTASRRRSTASTP